MVTQNFELPLIKALVLEYLKITIFSCSYIIYVIKNKGLTFFEILRNIFI